MAKSKERKEDPLKTLAYTAKMRLAKNSYTPDLPKPPKNATPRQKEIYVKLCELKRDGKDVENPIQCFGDAQTLATLTVEERQRYIIQICADYISMKSLIDGK